ncbi:MAG TPA: hypothetical protein VIO36_02850, partial [Anaerolineaceae bacterium]
MYKAAWSILLAIVMSVQSIGPRAYSVAAISNDRPAASVRYQEPTSLPSDTPTPFETPTPSDTPPATETAQPSETLTPSDTPPATETAQPTETPLATETPAASDFFSEPEAMPETSFEISESGELILQGDDVEVEVPEEGAKLSAFKGQIKLDFPRAALDQAMRVRIRKANPDDFPYTLSSSPFEITAQGKRTEKAIKKFKKHFTIQVSYIPEWIIGEEKDLTLFYFDEDSQSWLPLRSTVDLEAHTITAESDHLTVFDFDTENWQPGLLPSVKEFQVSDFTGAANYTYPLELPPGPGGMSYPLAFSYSSQVIDEMTTNSQPDWVGAGWSFDTGYIRRNTYGTFEVTTDDSFSLNLNGQSYPLWKSYGGLYHTESESFLKIEKISNPDRFIVHATTGFIYYFDKTAAYPYFLYPNTPAECAYDHDITWQWSLTKVINPQGKEIILTYTTDIRNVDDICGGSTTYPMGIAVYPATITYPNNRYQIQFDIRPDRLDINNSWVSGNRVFYKRYRLVNVRIMHAPAAGSFTELIRRYELAYAGDVGQEEDYIFPGHFFDKGAHPLTLKKILRYGADDTLLHAVTFAYDGMHLVSATNGYGGSIHYTYAPWSEEETSAGRSWTDNIGVTYSCYDGVSEQHVWDDDDLGGVYCIDDELRIGSLAYKKFTRNYVRPGSVYRFNASFSYNSNNVTFGILVNGVEYLASTRLSDTGVEAVIPMPVDAGKEFTLRIHCWDCQMTSFRMTIFPTYYRVTEKTVNTGEDSNAYQYAYDAAATNTDRNSALGDHPYTPRYGEFRGHARADVIEPEAGGFISAHSTWYHQTSVLKGKPQAQASYRLLFREDFEDENAFDPTQWESASSGAQYQIEPREGDLALNIYTTSTPISHPMHAAARAVLFQFRLNGGSNTDYFIAQGENSVGVCANWSSGNYDLRLYLDGCTGNSLLSGSNVRVGYWYTALIITGEAQSSVWVWGEDRSTPVGWKAVALSFAPGGAFVIQTAEATILDIDAYREGVVHSLSTYTYGYTTSELSVPTSGDITYTGMGIYWTYMQNENHFTFEDSGYFLGVQKAYEYNPEDQRNASSVPSQYGNLTRTTESVYQDCGGPEGWYPHRLAVTSFRPNDTSSVYLVALPAREAVYTRVGGNLCAGGALNVLQSETLYLYNGAGDFDRSPASAVLTGKRVLVENNPGKKYSDEDYAYDTWGNLAQVTRYTDYGKVGVPAYYGEQETRYCYGVLNGTTCASDGYHTYLGGETNALGHSTRISYNYRLGVPETETDPNGNTTTATYDAHGRMATLERPGETLGPDVVLWYGIGNGYDVNIQQRIDAGTILDIDRHYDGVGQLRWSIINDAVLEDNECGPDADADADVCDVRVDYTYDALGRVIDQTTPYSNPANVGHTLTTYDGRGRVLQVIAADGTTTRTAYTLELHDGEAHAVTRVSDDQDQVTTQVSDARGRLVAVIAPESLLSSAYAYDEAGQLTAATVGGATTQISYDLGGRKTGMLDADMGAWSYAYDALGNLKEQTDARGCIVSLYYDGLNRLNTRVYAGACAGMRSVYYHYDRYLSSHYRAELEQNMVGRRTEMSDASGLTTWYYDERGQAIGEYRQVSGVGLFAAAWDYNDAGLVSQMWYPGGSQGQLGEAVTYTYRKQQALNTITGLDSYVTGSSYDAAGRLRQRNLGSSTRMVTSREYQPWSSGGRLYRLGAGNLDTPEAFFYLQYSYDPVGNITAIDDQANPSLTQSFTYDELDRLVTASATGSGNYSESYSYDANGRLATKAGVTYTYNSGHYHAVSGLSNGNAYGYDANGNMTARSVGGVSYALEYDADNHLARQGVVDQDGYRYVYDGDGQLVVKIDEASGERSVYLGSYAEVTYTGAAAATPTPSATLSPTASRTPLPSRTSTPVPTQTRT